MIQVLCSICDQTFEADESAAGRSEFCPSCGTLNDVPSIDAQDVPVDAPIESLTLRPPNPNSRSPIRLLGWLVALAAAAVFVVACFFTLRPDWESQHLVDLSHQVTRADSAMAAGDFASARQDYQSAIDAVANRTIQSDYLRNLISRARVGLQQANSPHNAIAASSRAASAPSTVPSVVPAEGQLSTDQAVRDFQRASEGFAAFASARPTAYTDDLGRWRRRRFIIYDIRRDLKLQADPPSIVLSYTCIVRTTQPRDNKSDALADGDFNIPDPSGIIHCQTNFQLQGQRWQIVRHSREDPSAKPSWLNDLYAIEAQAFAGN
jgi:hypothetical protein